MTIAKDFAQKASIAFVALAMIFSLVAPGAFAQAQTAEELQQMINQLMQQIAALQGGSTSTGTTSGTGYVWTRDLKQGSTGADVLELQKFLNSDADTRVAATGAGSAGMETDYFGPATAAAVSKFQVKYRSEVLSPSGLVNPTGYFGSASRAKANALNTPVVVPPVTGGETNDDDEDEEVEEDSRDTTLRGGGADVKSVDIYSEEDAALDARDQEVATFELDLGRNSGDVRVTRVDVHAKANGANEDRLYRILDAVSIVQDGEVLGTARTSSRNDWSNSSIISGGEYVRISGLNGIARGDSITTFSVVVDTARLSSSDLPIDIDLAVDVLYEDSTGYFETEDTTPINFSIEDEDAADFKVKANQNNPEAFIIKGEDNKTITSDDVLVFDIESRDADSEIDTIKVDVKTSVDDANKVVRKAVLYQGSTRIDSQNVTASTTDSDYVEATFDLRDYALRADRPETFSVRLELNKIDGTNVHDGNKVTVRVLNVTGYDASDNKVVYTSTSFGSKEHTYSLVAAEFTNFKWNTSKAASGNTGIITFQFTVRADDDDFTFSTTSLSATTTGSATIAAPTWSVVSGASYANLSGSNYTVDEDEQVTFEVLWDITGPGSANITVEEVAGQSVPSDKQSSGSQVF